MDSQCRCTVSLTLCLWLHRYKIIQKVKVPTAGDDKKKSTDLLLKYDKTKKEWQLGKTKVTLVKAATNHKQPMS